MEWKSWQGNLKTLDSGSGGFEGFASVFNVRDDGGDVVLPGAFADTLPSFIRDGFIADGHNWDSVSDGAIGYVDDAYEDGKGLYLKVAYHSTPRAQAARAIAQERMARNKSVGLSIGYAINPGGSDFAEDGSRHIKSVKLFEVSQVNVPMLRPAGLTGVKGYGLSFEEHSEQLRVALVEWLERIRSGSDVRLKEGRPISEARRIRISGVKDSLATAIEEIQALLEETEPRKPVDERPVVEVASATDPELAALFARFQELDAMHQYTGATR